MPNKTVRANGGAMPKSNCLTTRLLPDELPETYCMECDGTCLEPMIMDGTMLMFSRDEQYMPGDLVCLFLRPEVVKPGEHQLLVKKLVLAPPHRFWKDPSCSAGSNIKPVVIVEMLNPRRMLYINPDALLGIHKCIGPVPDGMGTYKVTDEDVRSERAKIAASASMPVTRRGAVAFVASGVFACVPGAATSDTLVADATHDPLLDAINAYHTAMADYNANAPDDDEGADAYADATFVPAMDVIEAWDQPARTKQGAIEALRFAISETTMFEASSMVKPVLIAALAYFEREAV
jgi:hypothetical protein